MPNAELVDPTQFDCIVVVGGPLSALRMPAALNVYLKKKGGRRRVCPWSASARAASSWRG